MSEIEGSKNENLIYLVRECSFLYDFRHPDYKDAVKKAEAWKYIADKLDQSIDAVKLKWKNLRDSYVKYLKYLKGATGSEKKFKNWPWATHMDFLKDSITPRQRVSNVSESSQTEVVQVKEDRNDSGSVTNDNSQISPTKKLKPRKKQNEGGVAKILRYLPNKTVNKPKTHLDHTDHLFLSYADTFKKLSPRTQAVLKMELAQMFGRAELADMDQNSPPFSPLSH